MSEPIRLADLIRQHQDRTGEPYAQIAKRAGLSKAKVGQLALTDTPHMPRVETLRKLATGLQVPFVVVQSAAMVTAGISTETDGESQRMQRLVAILGDLSEEDFDAVEYFIEALAHRRG